MLLITPPNKTQAGVNALIGVILLLFAGPRLIRLLGWIGAGLGLLLLLYVGINLAFFLGWHGPRSLFETARSCPHCGADSVRKQDRFCRSCGRPVG
jgi:hypothetical protein